MHKKSQAALEFLTTYAWAFILIIIVIAAIAYFGVLRPRQILPDRCLFNVGFGCQAYTIDDAGTFNLRLRNQIGDVIDVTAITLMREDETVITCTTPPAMPANWRVAQVQDLAWSGCAYAGTGFVDGEKGKILVRLDFFPTVSGATYAKTADGEVLTTVQ